jgi:hypothetical protein
MPNALDIYFEFTSIFHFVIQTFLLQEILVSVDIVLENGEIMNGSTITITNKDGMSIWQMSNLSLEHI